MRGVVHTTTLTPLGPVHSAAIITTTQDGTCIATCQRTGLSASALTVHGALNALRRLLEAV